MLEPSTKYDYDLDVEYIQNLSTIRTLIKQAKSNIYLNQYRFWLEKLSDVSAAEKSLRNQYLQVLTQQIRNNALEGPFVDQPPEGGLAPLNQAIIPEKNSSKRKIKCKVRPHSFGSKNKGQLDAYESSWSDVTTEDDLRVNDSKNLWETWSGKTEENKTHQIEEISSTSRRPIETSNKDLQNVNNKNSSFIFADCKQTIESLQVRLTETLTQNNELKTIITDLGLQKQEQEAMVNELTRKYDLQHEENLKNVSEIQEMDESHQMKLSEVHKSYENQLQSIRNTYETKLLKQHEEYESFLKDKDKEIAKLNNIIHQQCIRLDNEMSAFKNQLETVAAVNNTEEEKIAFLQKCVTKMDKLFQKSEKEYVKQIEKLKAQLNYKDIFNQIQIKTQRADIVTKTISDKHFQFETLVTNLEMKYKNILELQEAQTFELKKHYEDKIDKLKAILTRNDITCDVD